MYVLEEDSNIGRLGLAKKKKRRLSLNIGQPCVLDALMLFEKNSLQNFSKKTKSDYYE